MTYWINGITGKKITDAQIDKIKADGIKEMLEQFSTEKLPDCGGKYLSVNMMHYYADKLRGKK